MLLFSDVVRFGLIHCLGIVTASCLLSACGGDKTTNDSGGSVTPVVFTVNAVASEGGSISPTSRNVQSGQTAAFTLSTNSGYRLTSVNGCGGSLSGNTYTTGSINANCTVSASFSLNSYTITAIAGEGGSITPSSSQVQHGAVAQFTLTANNGYVQAQVTGCGGSLDGTLYQTAPVTAACQVEAVFSPITISGVLAGVDGPLTANVKNAEEVHFHPDSKGFLPITGHADSPAMPPPEGVNFPFGIFDFRAIHQVAGGAVSVEFTYPQALPGNVSYWKYGSASAGAEPDWFELAPTQMQISADRKTLLLTIYDGQLGDIDGEINGVIRDPGGPAIRNSYIVTASASLGAVITPTSSVVAHGDTANFIITTTAGYSIDMVRGCNGDLVGNTYITGDITENCHVGVSTSMNSYLVHATAGEGGSISPGSATVSHGSSTSFTVEATTGYGISTVSGCSGSLSGNTYTTGPITAACSVSASFSQNSYTVTATAGEGGSISPGSVTVSHGGSAVFTVEAAPGYGISTVSGCNGSLNGNTYTTEPIIAACSVSANFSQNSYTVMANAGEGGSISPGSVIVNHGGSASFTVEAATGYSINSVTGCGGSLSGNTYTTGFITAECSISASFSQNSYTVTATAGEGGSISPSSVAVKHGETASFVVSIETGYELANVTGCQGLLSNLIFKTAAITGSCDIEAMFTRIVPSELTISSRASYGGELYPKSFVLKPTDNVEFTVTPMQGYFLESITGCDGELNNLTYQIHGINSDCEVVAKFTAPEFTTFDSTITSYMSNYQLKQGVVGVIRNERLVYLKHYGNNEEFHLIEQSYRLASVSKPLTLISILHLVERGLIKLSDKPFAAEGILYNDLVAAPYVNLAEKITLDHLLRHASGWNNNPFDPAFSPVSDTLQQLFEQMVQQRSLVAAPGEKINYLNFGYIVLSRVIEKASGMTVDNYLSTQIFHHVTPFRIFTAGSAKADKQPDEVEYVSLFGEMPYFMNIPRMSGAGGLAANVRTLANILIRIDRNSRVPDVLSSNTLNYYFASSWYHYGSLPGTSTFIGKLNNEYSVVALFNSRSTDYVNQNEEFFRLISEIHKQVDWPDIDLLQTKESN